MCWEPSLPRGHLKTLTCEGGNDHQGAVAPLQGLKSRRCEGHVTEEIHLEWQK